MGRYRPAGRKRRYNRLTENVRSPFQAEPIQLAHTAPIYVTIQGVPPLSAQPAAKDLARKWLARLRDLEMRLDEDYIQHLAAPPDSGDGVGEEHLRKNRVALLQAIHASEKYFEELER